MHNHLLSSNSQRKLFLSLASALPTAAYHLLSTCPSMQNTMLIIFSFCLRTICLLSDVSLRLHHPTSSQMLPYLPFFWLFVPSTAFLLLRLLLENSNHIKSQQLPRLSPPCSDHLPLVRSSESTIETAFLYLRHFTEPCPALVHRTKHLHHYSASVSPNLKGLGFC
jgi:hypothetical protein